MEPTDKVIRLDGPYEAWVFGNEGQSYANASGKLAGASFVAALAELPVKNPLFWQKTQKSIEDVGVAHRPTIWRSASGFPQAGGTAFLPLVLELKPDTERTLSALHTLMLALSKDFGPFFVDASPKPHHGFRLNAPLPSETFDQKFAASQLQPEFRPKDLLKANLPGEGAEGEPLVIMAVIDDGLAYGHPTLHDRDGETRMEFCWLQSAKHSDKDAERTVLFGREHTRHSLTELLAETGGDEDAFYRAAGSIRDSGMAQRLAGLKTHGAHVMHLAAGSWGQDVKPDELERMRVIGVELPPPIVMDTVGFGKDAYILSAFHYIFDRAEKIAKAYGVVDPPLVINFSFGSAGGPQDGSDRLEDAINQLIAARPKTQLVMPAGNHFLSALHAEISNANLEGKDRFEIPWRIQPSDQTANYLEIWYPQEEEGKDSPKPERPVITPPGNGGREADLKLLTTATMPPQELWSLSIDGHVVGQVSIDKFREKRWRTMVILAPTEVPHAKPAGAPAGLWRIDVDAKRIKGTSEIIACRIQRDQNSAHPLIRGRQSYFDHPAYKVFADDGSRRQVDEPGGFTRRFGSLNGLATTEGVVVVAGVVAHSAAGPDLPTPYSAAGRLVASPPGKAVSCAAVSDHSPTLRGVRTAGTRSGSASRLSGTSAAAPQVARARALRLLREDPAQRRIGNGTQQAGISGEVDLKAPPAPGPGQRMSKAPSARTGAGVLAAATPDG